MSRYVFDIESDDLLLGITRMWMLFAVNIDTRERHLFIGDDTRWKQLFDNATLLVGHNIAGFDLPALKKLYGWVRPRNCKIRDTLLLSEILDYQRFKKRGHSLGEWGNFLNYPKGDFTDYKGPAEGETVIEWLERMRIYCEQDVDLNLEVYQSLMSELGAKV